MNFVAASIYQKASRLAISEGLSPDALSHHRFDKNMPYVPLGFLWEVYELAHQQLAEGFSLRFGQQLAAEDYGTLGLSWKTCWSARDILERTERYMVLVTNHGTIKVEDINDTTKTQLFRTPEHRGLEISNETTFAMIIKIIKDVTEADIYPTLVRFQHAPPSRITPYLEYFNCPVQFKQSENAFYYKTADLSTPTVKADKSIHQFLVERMDEEAQGIEVNANKLVKDVQNLIEEALPSGIPSVNQIGAHLGMSSRTLKRRLAEHDMTFRSLVKNTQESISIQLLKHSSHSIGEIAFQAGYSEQSAFNRAFKRWTGQSPVAYRRGQ